MDPTRNAASSPVALVNSAFRNAKARRCIVPKLPRTERSPCCDTSKRAAVSGKPAAWSGSTRTRWSAWPWSPANTPKNSTTNSWLFPPKTREVQFDEKWSFVGKKEKHCDPAKPEDAHQGDNWDHVAFDPEHRLVVSVVPGKRTEDKVHELV